MVRSVDSLTSALKEKAQEKTFLYEWVAIGWLLLWNLAITYSQHAFFPFFSGSKSLYFHSLLFFVPFVMVATMLRFSRYLICAVVLGLALSVHATWMPLDYFEMSFAHPLVSILGSALGSSIIWCVLHVVHNWCAQSATDGQKKTAVVILAQVASLLVSSLLVSVVIILLLTLTGSMDQLNYSDQTLSNVGQFLAMPSFWLQVLFDFLLMTLLLIPSELFIRYMRSGRANRSLRAVFRRWLFLSVLCAFVATNTIGYCVETNRALEEASRTLDSNLDYLCSQVEERSRSLQMLKEAENEVVLSKARSVAGFIQLDPRIVQDKDGLLELKRDLNLASIAVCDGDGRVVADPDADESASFNFADTEQTRKYLALVDGGVSEIVEEPRNSVDQNGETLSVQVFAGVPRQDADGFVQVSVDADAYQRALTAASVNTIAQSYSFGEEGLVFITEGGEVISTNSSDLDGEGLKEFFSIPEGMAGDEGILNSEMLSRLFNGEMYLAQDDESADVLYLKARRVNDYGVFVVATANELFANRTATILLNGLFYFVLVAIVFLLTSLLLDRVVVRGFVRTNGVLELITAGDLEQRVEEHVTEEFDALSDGINTTVGALKDSISEAETRYDNELATAKAIQASALPSTFPPYPEIDAFDLFANMNPAKEVGGDFYDFFLIDDQTLGFLIADVSGKGIPAALFMMTAKTQIENYMLTGMPLSEAIHTANHHLCIGNEAGMFVTVWAATLNWKTGELTFVNAGHNPPLLRHEGHWEWITKRNGLFLGTFEMAKYSSTTLTLAKGDELLLYTDGVNEAFSADAVEYGNDRLEALLDKHVGEHPRELIGIVRRDVAAWTEGAEQSDDITMVSLEYGVTPEVSASVTVAATVDMVDTLINFVHDELKRRLCPISVQNKVDIALEELFVNICKYAYANQDVPGNVTMRYVFTTNPSTITVMLEDTGAPFDPLAYIQGHVDESSWEGDSLGNLSRNGLGIRLAARAADDVSYMRDGNRNQIVFTKRW